MKKLSKYVLLVFLCIFTINAQDKSVKLITDYKILFSYNIVDESTFCWWLYFVNNIIMKRIFFIWFIFLSFSDCGNNYLIVN